MSERILTVEERAAYCAALADDWSGDADADGKEADEFTWSEVWSVFTEGGHVLLLCLPLFFSGVTVSISPYSGFQGAHDLAIQLYGLANFTPTTVGALGYSATRTQLLTVSPSLRTFNDVRINHFNFIDQVPPYACSFVISIVCSYLCDKYKQRGAMAIGTSILSAIGYAIFLGELVGVR